ncbi:hypothetical protein Btru_028598 [Bulinus truncatus]|nr:hypothetical protein Btru_028598 [Bulinus truncatus]
MPERKSQRVFERMSERMPERKSQRIFERMPERKSQRVFERMSERMPERKSQRVFERMFERMPKRKYQRVFERMFERMSERMPERKSQRIFERMPERKSQRVFERMSERMPERKSQRIEIDDDKVGISDRAKFQQINKHDAWVYSAFYHTVNNKRLIRVFGAQAPELNETILCYMREKETSYFTAENRTLLHDYRNKGRRIFSYECELRKNSRPSTVSIVFNQSDTPANTIKVFYPLPLQRNFTVSYGILYSFKHYKQLVQNVKFNRVLGAEHVFVYKLSVFKQTEAVLKYYQKQRFMTVIEWTVPVSELHYFGQDLAINDCVYRNKGVSRFVVIQDTDEFIIPNHQDNWYDLITEIDQDYYASRKKAVSKLALYIFESTSFTEKPNISEWAAIKLNNALTSEEEQFFEKYSLTVFTHVRRLNKTFGQAR